MTGRIFSIEKYYSGQHQSKIKSELAFAMNRSFRGLDWFQYKLENATQHREVDFVKAEK